MPKLTEILQQPEGRKLEFKESLPTNSDLAKTIIAFANDAGGIAFRVTFIKKNFIPDTTEELFSDASEKTSEKILELIEGNRNITIKELSESVGVSTRSIERNLTKLQKDKKLKRVGGDKGGYWEIMKDLK